MKPLVCIDCGDKKPADDFYRHPTSTNGRQSRCKICDNRKRSGNQILERLGFIDGPVSGKAATYLEIATVLGVTKQAVEKIEKRALVKLRKAAVRMGILLAALVVAACSDRPAGCRQKFYRAGDVSAVTCGPDSVRVDRLDHSYLCCPGDQ